MNTPKQIGDTLNFTTEYSASGARNLCGVIEGRDWAFDRLLAYTVRTLSGHRYHVNADSLEAGRPF